MKIKFIKEIANRRDLFSDLNPKRSIELMETQKHCFLLRF